MSKKNFQNFRLEDLTGGINVRDYASEIDDKQCISLKNFNFKGNKLISEKGTQQIDDYGGNIQGLTINNDERWTIKNNILYKNGSEIVSKKGARLGVKGLSYTYIKDILNGNGDIVTKINNTSTYFPEGIDYAITVNGVDFIVSGTSKSDLYNKLKTQLELAGYTCIISGDYIYITSNSNIVISIPSYTQKVIFLQNTITNSSFWQNNYSKGFYWFIGGVRGMFFTNKSYSDYGTATKFDIGIRDDFYNMLKVYFPTIKKTTLNKDLNGNLIISGESFGDYSAIILPLNTDATFDLSNTMRFITFWNYTDAYNNNREITFNKGGVISSVKLHDANLTSINDFWQWLSNNGFNKSKQYISFVEQSGFPTFSNTVLVQGDNYEPVITGGWDDLTTMSANQYIYYFITYKDFIISDNSFDYLGLNSTIGNLGRTDITIGNLGNLIIDEDGGGALYYGEDLIVGLEESSIGKPTCGTIYNGKIILGGYTGKDNIIFSQTATPTQPFNLLNFTNYSAGGQSISGGDRGEIRGFSVGENGLYVFKNNSVWYSNSEKDDPTSNSFNFIFRKITSNGALSQRVITNVQQEIFYLDWEGRAVRRLGYEQNLTTLRDSAISDEIRPLLELLPIDQGLATSHFVYPNYTLSLSDHTGGTITYGNGKTYYLNNKHFIYNVETKSWTTKTGLNYIVSNKGFFASNGKIYKDYVGTTTEEGEIISKLYTFGDDIIYKKYGELGIVGKSIGEKTLTIEIYIDGEKVDERIYTYNNKDIREKIDLYDVGQGIQWKIKHSGSGILELYDVYTKWKTTNIQPQDYF